MSTHLNLPEIKIKYMQTSPLETQKLHKFDDSDDENIPPDIHKGDSEIISLRLKETHFSGNCVIFL